MLITSTRGFGKTASILRYITENCSKDWQFIYVRQTDETLGRVKNNLFEVCEDLEWIKPGEIVCMGGEYVRKDEEGRPQVVGYPVALNVSSQFKGINYSKVKLIFVDEFIDENGRYIANEFSKFLSLISTALRRRDCKIVMAANCASIYNPYYVGWGIRPNPNEEFTKIPERDMLIQNAQASEFQEAMKETLAYKLLKGTEYGDFALENKNILDKYDFVKVVRSQKYVDFNIYAIECLFRVSRFSHEDTGIALYCEKIDKPDVGVRTFNVDKTLKEGSFKIMRNHPVVRQLRSFAKRACVYFDTPFTKQAVEELIK